jgi:uncharacterized protein (TIGR02246 family)
MRRTPSLAKTLALALLTLASGSLLAAAGPAASSGCAQNAETAVKAVLAIQSAAWNRGDLEAFTAVYAEDASFLSPSGLTKGRQQVLARYRKRYPDKQAMGTLTLEVQEVRVFETDVNPGNGRACRATGAAVAARWQLAYPGQPEKKTAEGLTLLVLKPRGESWEIVDDASM